MFEEFLKRGLAAWDRFVDRLPLSEHPIEPELPAEAFGIVVPRTETTNRPVPPTASDRPESK